MPLNSFVETPAVGTFTLEDLGLAQEGETPIRTKDPVNDNGVLGTQKGDQPAAVIETSMDPGTQPTTLSQDEIEQIPAWNTRIKLCGEHADKVVEMQKIQQDIEGAGKIDQFQSDVIETTFEGFYTPRNSRAMFTTFESRVNYDSSVAFMKQRLELSKEALLTEYTQVNTDVKSQMAEDLLKSRDFCVHELRDIVVAATDRIQAVTQKLCSGNIILPLKDDTFLNISSADFTQLKLSDIKDTVPFAPGFEAAFEQLVEIWTTDENIRLYVEECMGMHKDSCPGAVTPDTQSGLFLATLLASFGSWTGDVMYNEFVVKTDQKTRELEGVLDTAQKAVEASSDEAIVAISKHMAPAAIAADALVTATASAQKLGDFAKAAATVVVALASL